MFELVENAPIKWNVRDTSREAFDYCNEHGITQHEQKVIIETMMGGPETMTRREIAYATGMETSSVSARVNALIKSGAIEELGKRECRITGRNAHALKLREVCLERSIKRKIEVWYA